MIDQAKEKPVEEFVEETEIIDRSTLERWATCPYQAKLVSEGKVITSSTCAAAGQECHEAFALAVKEYVEVGSIVSAGDLAETVRQYCLHARPDVQPLALDSIKYTAWIWAKWLKTIPPHAILRFDSGEGEHSGQLAWELDGATLTAEMDLVVSGASPEILEIYDWKTGRKDWSATSVRESFQFRFYSWLALQNYDVREVHVRVFCSRLNKWTGYVAFDREDAEEIRGQLLAAIAVKREHEGVDEPETWPDEEKCRICPAASVCPSAGLEASRLAADPGGFIGEMYKLENKVKAMKKAAAEYADEYGTIEGPMGLRFGKDKPAERKATAAFYKGG